MNQVYRRFGIFQGQSLVPVPKAPEKDFYVDFHTDHAPIIACGCTSLKDLFLTNEGSTTTISLYVIKRKSRSKEELSEHAKKSKERMYIADSAWQPSIPQTERGMAAFLSSLFRLAYSIPIRGTVAEDRMLSILYQITSFPPAVRSRKFD